MLNPIIRMRDQNAKRTHRGGGNKGQSVVVVDLTALSRHPNIKVEVPNMLRVLMWSPHFFSFPARRAVGLA